MSVYVSLIALLYTIQASLYLMFTTSLKTYISIIIIIAFIKFLINSLFSKMRVYAEGFIHFSFSSHKCFGVCTLIHSLTNYFF